jgi:hypothetical protein
VVSAPGDPSTTPPARVVFELDDLDRIFAPIDFPLTLRLGEQIRGMDEGASLAFEFPAPASGYVRAVFDLKAIWLPADAGRSTTLGRSACCVIAWRDPFEMSSEVASCSVDSDGRVCDPGAAESPCGCLEGTHPLSPGLASDRICGSGRRCLRSPRVRVLGNRRIQIWLGHATSAVEVDVARDPSDVVDTTLTPGPDRLIHVFREAPDPGETRSIAALAIPVGHCAWLRMKDDDLEAVFSAGLTRRVAGGSVRCGNPWDAAVERAARCAGETGCRSRALRRALEICVAATDDPLWPECASLVAQIAAPARPGEPAPGPSAERP